MASSTPRAIRRQASSGPCSISVGTLTHDSGRPKSSTIPILMLVPPRSTPAKNGGRASPAAINSRCSLISVWSFRKNSPKGDSEARQYTCFSWGEQREAKSLPHDGARQSSNPRLMIIRADRKSPAICPKEGANKGSGPLNERFSTGIREFFESSGGKGHFEIASDRVSRQNCPTRPQPTLSETPVDKLEL